jgi:3-oxoacyl-[acyl-carrier protein] reductase
MDMAPYITDKMAGRSTGRLIYISPWAWDRHANRIRYETVTAGLLALTRDIALQVGKFGVNVNCLVPGYIRTIRPSLLEQEFALEVTNTIPMGYVGEMQDITDVILFLSSDASKYVTGQEIKVNGGLDQ